MADGLLGGALYEQQRVHHVGFFDELENQMCSWEPDTGQPSPDRLDALVYACSDLIRPRPQLVVYRKPSPAVIPIFAR